MRDVVGDGRLELLALLPTSLACLQARTKHVTSVALLGSVPEEEHDDMWFCISCWPFMLPSHSVCGAPQGWSGKFSDDGLLMSNCIKLRSQLRTSRLPSGMSSRSILASVAMTASLSSDLLLRPGSVDLHGTAERRCAPPSDVLLGVSPLLPLPTG